MLSFLDKYGQRVDEINSRLCVCLDPRFKDDKPNNIVRGKIVEKNRIVIEETLPYCSCYKPNIAFYERYGPYGLEALIETLYLIPISVPIILDAKRADIGETSWAYAEEIFGLYDVDATTTNPYLGFEAVEPFIKYEKKFLFVLTRTTNPGSSVIQNLKVDGEPLYINITKKVYSWAPNIGVVVSGNDIEAIKKTREIFPFIWILSPGIGAQKGVIQEVVKYGKPNIIPVVGRHIYEAEDPGSSARDFRDKINEVIDD